MNLPQKIHETHPVIDGQRGEPFENLCEPVHVCAVVALHRLLDAQAFNRRAQFQEL